MRAKMLQSSVGSEVDFFTFIILLLQDKHIIAMLLDITILDSSTTF